MALRTNSAEGGSDGTAVTTGNSGGTSGDAWDVITLGGSSTAVFEDAQAMHGALSYAMSPASSQNCIIRWNYSNHNAAAFRIYLYLTGAPSAASQIVFYTTSAGGQLCQVRMNTNRTLFVTNSAGASVAGSTFTNAVPLTTWVRIEGKIDQSGGTVDLALYTGDSTTATEEKNLTSVSLGTATTIGTVRFGRGATGTMAVFYLDDLGYEDGRTSYLGPTSSAIDLVVQESDHAHTADAVTLTQVHELAVADSAHAHSAEAVTLTQGHVLAVAASTHAHSAESTTLAQVHNLTVDDSVHAHTADTPTLDQAPTLTVADTAHSHSADVVTLTQGHQLQVAESAHAHTAENVALTQIHGLELDDSSHHHAAESVTLDQVHVLAVSDTAHAHAVEQVTLAVGGITLTVADTLHAHVVDALTLTQVHLITAADSVHEHQVDSVTLGDDTVIEMAGLLISVPDPRYLVSLDEPRPLVSLPDDRILTSLEDA